MTDEPVAGAGPALFQLVRFWSRRWAAGVAGRLADNQGSDDQGCDDQNPGGQNPDDQHPGGQDGQNPGGQDAAGRGSGVPDAGGRPGAHRAGHQRLGDPHRVPNVLVVEAVHAAGAHPGEVTVAEVAHQLGVDRSVASRMVAEAVNAGHVRRDASARDARRASLSLTGSGQALLHASHAYQEEVFAQLVAGWSGADQRRFAGYLRRLAAEVLPGEGPA
ncbi:MarR family winged helix-turn-helix transcriptional regulator [Goodfellowiella coeruleoviolacea]|uniref:DNA-binding transcriptional regulator, MarR family n=1 Tax=Goodfellowiella coeruleoviolacea TaxID=334858 RepID=A0AAE3GBE6_9PSEU|nr:MarR family winged helix-turn-helix transcriptional regulator [Goodfellowiella coeruleoviolacea]MCP2165206.1 DNA-binding transcriptional regulator, MarR family [Goodfellowiella coeruleoviolacea]